MSRREPSTLRPAAASAAAGALQAELGEEKASGLVGKALGEPELGFLLVCTADFAVADGFGGDVRLTRTQTIMQGASHCDFRYRRVKATE